VVSPNSIGLVFVGGCFAVVVMDPIAGGPSVREADSSMPCFLNRYGSLFAVSVFFGCVVFWAIRKKHSRRSMLSDRVNQWRFACRYYRASMRGHIGLLGERPSRLWFRANVQKNERDCLMQQLMRKIYYCYALASSSERQKISADKDVDQTDTVGRRYPSDKKADKKTLQRSLFEMKEAYQDVVQTFDGFLQFLPSSSDAQPVEARVVDGELFSCSEDRSVTKCGEVGWFPALEEKIEPELQLRRRATCRLEVLGDYYKPCEKEGFNDLSDPDSLPGLLQLVPFLKRQEEIHLKEISNFEGKIRGHVVCDGESQALSQEREGLHQRDEKLDKNLKKLSGKFVCVHRGSK